MLSTTIPTETNFTNNPLEYKISPINTPTNFNHSKIESTRNLDNTPVDLSIDSQISAPLLEHKTSQTNMNGRRKKRTLEDFEILSKNPDELGRGTYSQVQLVREKRPPYRLYAMKVINKDDLRDQHMVGHLKREVKIHKKLNHPHIVRLCCYFEDNENAYLVLEHAQNGSLLTYLKSKEKLEEAEAFIYCFHICLGLDYLHRKGIVHRDLKTENLLINEFGNVLLSDFGFSVEDSENRNTFCGTLDYIAPEMIQNLPHDKKVDIWALGIVLYELLHGSTPFKDLTFESTIETFKQDINFGDISEGAKSFIKSLLQINPSDRPDFITIFNHPWMQKHAKKHHIDINYYLDKNMDALSTSETSELALRKSISNPVKLPSMSDSEISVEQVPVPTLYDSAMIAMDSLAYTGIEQQNNMEDKVNGDSDLSQLVLNGPLIQSDKTEAEESSSMEGSEKIESENTSPLKKKDIWQEVNIIEPVNKSEQFLNKEERPKTPTSTSRGRNPAKKRYDKENVAGLNNSNESPLKESKSPIKSSFEDRRAKKQPVTESAPGTEPSSLPSSTSLDHVQIYRFDPNLLRMPDFTVSENRIKKGETIEDLKITDVGSSEGVMDPIAMDLTRDLAGNATRKDLSVTEDLHSNRTKEMSPLSHFQNKVEVKEKVVYENISIKGELALEEAFPAPIVHNLPSLGLPGKKSKETSPIVHVQRDLGREEIKTETSSESSRSFINNSELDAYIKTHPLHSREEVKELNHVFTTEVEALPVTLQDGPLIVQTQAILFETRPKLISSEGGAQEKDHRSKHLEQKEVTNLLNSFMDKSEREQARNKKLEFASLEPFETVKTKLESHTGGVKAGPTSFRAKNVVPKTEIEVTVQSSREPVNKVSQAPVEVYLDAPRGAKGHVEHPLARENVVESPHFSFGGASKLVKEDLLWPELDSRDNQSGDNMYQKSLENAMKKDESWRTLLTKSKSMPKASNVQTVKENAAIIMDNDVPYVFERIDVKGNNHEQVKRKKSGEDYEIERQLLLSKYKNKLNDLTNMSKQKEKQLEDDDDEEKVRESRPILKKGKTMDSAKNTVRILTFENSEEFDSKEEKSKRKKIKGLDPQSFNRSVKDLRRKNEQIESLLDDLNSGDRYVSRPSGKNFSYIRDEVPRESTPEKPGLFSKFMAMFGCVERERTSQPVKDIRPSLKRFNK